MKATMQRTMHSLREGRVNGAVNSVNGKVGDVVLTKNDLGLSNVDNTSDMEKPLSTPQDEAVNVKLGPLVSDIDDLETSVQGIRQDLTNQKHFKGYWKTTAEIEALLNVSGGDYAYNNETGTEWIYNGTSWEDTGRIVPDNVTPLSDSTPFKANASGSSGVGVEASRDDHTHPAQTKTDLGLGNVDNTADADKPVSTPQAQEIANTVNSHNDASNAHAILFGSKLRQRYLLADTDLYIATNGNDSNNGTISYPLKTWAGMLNWLRQTDMGGRLVTVKFLSGGYSGGTLVGSDLTGQITIDSADINNKAVFSGSQITFTGINQSKVFGAGNPLFRNIITQVQIHFHNTSGMIGELETNLAAGNWAGLRIGSHSDIWQVPRTGVTFKGNPNVGIDCTEGSVYNHGYSAVGNHLTFVSFVPATAAIRVVSCGDVRIQETNVAISGTVTGKPYDVGPFSILTLGNKVIPGTVAGTVDADGRVK